MTRRCRAVFVSDVHLGTRSCKAELLLEFLRSVECETLYLVGDIVDGWQLRRSWFWPRAHDAVVQHVLGLEDTEVVFVPGNHDESFRQYVGQRLGNVRILREAVHETADGRRLLVVHGDDHDVVMQHARWLAFVGDQGYTFSVWVNHWLNLLRQRLGLPYWSLSGYLKRSVKGALEFIDSFERSIVGEARRRGFDGVVCGHVHTPEIKQVDGLLYCNDGDWVDACTALVEHGDGRLELIDWIRERQAAAQAVADWDEELVEASVA